MKTARSGLLIGLLIGSSMVLGCASTAEPEVAEEEEEVESEEARRARLRRTKTTLPARHVKFSVKDADLKDEVLPLIEKQAGVRILWAGSSRRVKRLRFSEPVHWEDAMALVCQFTNTHLTRDYQGRRVLRHGYSGTLESNTKPRSGRGGGSGPQAGRGSATQPTRSRGGGTRRAGATTWENTYGGSPSNSSGDTAKRLLKGTTTRHSGGR